VNVQPVLPLKMPLLTISAPQALEVTASNKKKPGANACLERRNNLFAIRVIPVSIN
jgi:hypothetical protein